MELHEPLLLRTRDLLQVRDGIRHGRMHGEQERTGLLASVLVRDRGMQR
jgi:hypothetical protein